jgi:glutathione synthase/RimK-type ligase-like ATP-grasp enzyme
MARNHWQIVNWEKVEGREGKSTTIPLSEAPGQLIKTALNATRLIGDGLYGVDVKEANGKFYIIEINDNPSIDAGIEDKVEKENLYLRVMEIFMQRVKVY